MKSLIIVSIVLLISACSNRIDFPEDPSNAMEQLSYLEEARDARPDWTTQGLWTDGEFTYQVGQSKIFNTERASKKHAVRDASFRLSEYVTRSLDVDFSESVLSESDSSNYINQSSMSKEIAKSISRSVISSSYPEEFYTELRLSGDERIGYVSFVKLKAPNKELKVSIKREKDKLQAKKESMKQTHEIAKRD